MQKFLSKGNVALLGLILMQTRSNRSQYNVWMITRHSLNYMLFVDMYSKVPPRRTRVSNLPSQRQGVSLFHFPVLRYSTFSTQKNFLSIQKATRVLIPYLKRESLGGTSL